MGWNREARSSGLGQQHAFWPKLGIAVDDIFVDRMVGVRLRERWVFETVAGRAICCYDRTMSKDPTRRTLADLTADFDASDADAEAGRILPAEEVEAKIEAAIARLEGKLPHNRGRKAILTQ